MEKLKKKELIIYKAEFNHSSGLTQKHTNFTFKIKS